jgi:uncharacterized protein (TIGR02118 family)
MSEEEFFDYWKNVHAVKYGAKIPQVKGYLICARQSFGPEEADPLFHGAAEVWIENEADELAFARSKEYLEGSRLDEPNFLAFWQMFALDTTDHLICDGGIRPDGKGVKLYVLAKRRPGMALEDFRRYSLDVHAPNVARMPGLRKYVQCHVNDAHYALGESLLDSVSLLWFDSPEALAESAQSPVYKERVHPDFENFADPKYLRTMLTDEYWVVPLGSQS